MEYLLSVFIILIGTFIGSLIGVWLMFRFIFGRKHDHDGDFTGSD